MYMKSPYNLNFLVGWECLKTVYSVMGNFCIETDFYSLDLKENM